jgi:hypothetical protein
MTESPPGHESVLTSLLVCLHHWVRIHVVHWRCYLAMENFQLSSYYLACVGLSNGRPDQQFLMIICASSRYVDIISIFVNKTVPIRVSIFHGSLCFLNVAKLVKKKSFLHF